MRSVDHALLVTFLDLVETGSFTRTAARVHRTQSAVSAQLLRLEALLEARLFERTTRRMVLTPAGERLVPHARAVLDAQSALLAGFRDSEVVGDVRLGCPEDVAGADLPAILADFVATHPRVRFHVRCDLTLHLIEQFEAGAHDLVLIKQDPERILPGARMLRRETLAWVGTDAQARRPPAAMVPLVLAPAPCVYRARAIEALASAGLTGDVVYASTSEAAQVAAVRAGLGLTVLPVRRIPAGLIPAGAGWPPLMEAAICLLATRRPTAAVEALARHAETWLSDTAQETLAVTSDGDPG